MLQRLDEYGVAVNESKCVFGADRLTFLGHDVSADGIAPLQDRVAAITDFPRPSTRQALQRFLGMVTYYHRFIPHAAPLLRPLHQLVDRKSTSKRTTELFWSAEAEAAFSHVKQALAAATRLEHPVPGAPLSLQVDASDTGVGAVLQQFIGGIWRPLGFFSKTLQQAERRYSAFGRELLAIYLAIRHFRHSVEGRALIVFTDHLPLVSAIGSNSDHYSPREIRHLDFVAQYTTDIRHVPGALNTVPDTLSRTVSLLQSPRPPLEDFDALAEAQQEDQQLQSFLASHHSLKLRDARLPSGRTLLVDESTGSPRPLVPEALRRPLFQQLHDLSHPGVRASQQLVTSRFVWPGAANDVRRWTQSCTQCQRAKVQRHTKAPVGTFPPSSDRFSEVHIDLVGPLPPSDGYTYLLTCVDRLLVG